VKYVGRGNKASLEASDYNKDIKAFINASIKKIEWKNIII
jgi:hypothetical protein